MSSNAWINLIILASVLALVVRGVRSARVPWRKQVWMAAIWTAIIVTLVAVSRLFAPTGL